MADAPPRDAGLASGIINVTVDGAKTAGEIIGRRILDLGSGVDEGGAELGVGRVEPQAAAVGADREGHVTGEEPGVTAHPK